MNPSAVIEEASDRLRLLRTAGWRKETQRLRGRRQKRGKRAGLPARLKATNTKMDFMRVRMSSYKEMKTSTYADAAEQHARRSLPDGEATLLLSR